MVQGTLGELGFLRQIRGRWKERMGDYFCRGVEERGLRAETGAELRVRTLKKRGRKDRGWGMGDVGGFQAKEWEERGSVQAVDMEELGDSSTDDAEEVKVVTLE